MQPRERRIIAVEDLNEFIQKEETLLRREELNLVMVTSGNEALFRAQNDRPDLLILNFYMPDLNGYQVCRTLKADTFTENIPVLIIAPPADEDSDPVYLTEAAGCNGCIEKPIQQDDIVPLLVDFLGVPTRGHHRVDTALGCSIKDEDGKRDATIVNLTHDGLGLEATPAPWAGDIIEAEMSLKGAILNFQLAVRWSTETGAGGLGRAGCQFLGAPWELVGLLDEEE